ncbi:MAG: hypothetical protein ABJG86_18635, partial [Nitratireductor sp.]|uniref:hypothetical protein n=1 Tax=Alphaproteobacteria TaxID=28211 RepID=UPI0032675302
TKSRWRSQPVTVKKAGKLQPPALQSSVSEQKPENSSHRRSKVRSQSTGMRADIKTGPIEGGSLHDRFPKPVRIDRIGRQRS